MWRPRTASRTVNGDCGPAVDKSGQARETCGRYLPTPTGGVRCERTSPFDRDTHVYHIGRQIATEKPTVWPPAPNAAHAQSDAPPAAGFAPDNRQCASTVHFACQSAMSAIIPESRPVVWPHCAAAHPPRHSGPDCVPRSDARFASGGAAHRLCVCKTPIDVNMRPSFPCVGAYGSRCVRRERMTHGCRATVAGSKAVRCTQVVDR